jgi:hypothetical protein
MLEATVHEGGSRPLAWKGSIKDIDFAAQEIVFAYSECFFDACEGGRCPHHGVLLRFDPATGWFNSDYESRMSVSL